MWLLRFEPRSPLAQRGILTTKLQPQHIDNNTCTNSSSLSVRQKFPRPHRRIIVAKIKNQGFVR